MSSTADLAFPAGVEVHPSLQLATWHPRGVLNTTLAKGILAFVEGKEAAAIEPFERFADLSEIEAIHLTSAEVQQLADCRVANYQGAPVKSAILAFNPLAFGIAQMYQQLMRRHLVIAEANDIGTAFLRVDLLPADAQPALRDLFCRYLDSRIETYRRLADVEALKAERNRSAQLQGEIWSLAVSSTQKSATPQAAMLLLPALNEMIDITTTRMETANIHAPLIIWAMLGALAFACALFAGYDMAGRKQLNMLHSGAFATVLAVTVYVIVDLEYPRVGLIQVTDFKRILIGVIAFSFSNTSTGTTTRVSAPAIKPDGPG